MHVLLTALLVVGAWAPAGGPGHEGPRGLSVVAAARAQEVMKFEPVPDESVQAMEERRRKRPATRGRGARPEPSAPPSVRSGDVVRIGSDVHIELGRVVDGDVFTLRGDIRVDGHVKGNVATTGGDVHLGPTARVDGDVMCIGGELVEEPGAVVGGQRVTALSGGAGERRVSRAVRERLRDGLEGRLHDGLERAGRLGLALSWFLVSLLAAWGITKFAPGRTSVALATMKTDTGMSMLVGLLVGLLFVPSLVAVALVSAMLCITFIGIPLAIGLILGYLGLAAILLAWGFVVGIVPVGERLGARMGQESASLVRAAVTGVLVLAALRVGAEILQFVPFFGWVGKLMWLLAVVTIVVATFLGAGALLRSKLGQGPGGRWWPPFASASPAAAGGGMAPPVPPAAPGSSAPPALPPPGPGLGGPTA